MKVSVPENSVESGNAGFAGRAGREVPQTVSTRFSVISTSDDPIEARLLLRSSASTKNVMSTYPCEWRSHNIPAVMRVESMPIAVR
jgi:hypothetical protein